MATATAKPNIQIDDLVRPMTTEEHTAHKAQQTANAKAQAEAEARVAARQSALAKLAALGLTEAEIAALKQEKIT
jgi:DNA-binding NarL/FixJ family response regulator